MDIDGYTLADPNKVERAINGTVLDHGQLKGGVGADADGKDIIAEYDRIGGLILKGTYKVKMGSFYDFKGKKPIAKPKPMLVFVVNGETVEVDADKPLPIEVQAGEMANAKKAARGAKKSSKKSAKADDEEAEGDFA